MSKYTDTEKLIAEIEKKKKILISEYNELVENEVWISAKENKIKIYTISDILSLITSLQQEQQDNEEKLMNFFDAVGDCGFSQHDILLLKNIWKEAGCPPSKSQVADASKMEQPEVDLEKEIDNEYAPYEQTGFELTRWQFGNIARHFYNLGLNSKK